MWHCNLMDDLEKQYGTPSILREALCIISKPSVNSNLSYSHWNTQFGSKLAIFLSCVTLKFEGWPWKTIGHLLYAASIFVYHFIAISEFNLELQSGNAQFGSKSITFLSRVTLKFDRRPWTRQIWGIWKLRPAYSLETTNLGQNRWCFVPCDLEIWWMTLENNRASRLCCFKLCVTFHSHRWIQSGVTVRKRPIWVKFAIFRAVWPWNLTDDLEKQ